MRIRAPLSSLRGWSFLIFRSRSTAFAARSAILRANILWTSLYFGRFSIKRALKKRTLRGIFPAFRRGRRKKFSLPRACASARIFTYGTSRLITSIFMRACRSKNCFARFVLRWFLPNTTAPSARRLRRGSLFWRIGEMTACTEVQDYYRLSKNSI